MRRAEASYTLEPQQTSLRSARPGAVLRGATPGAHRRRRQHFPRDSHDHRLGAPKVTSSQLHKYLPASPKANKSERDQLIAILGLCGVLGTSEHPGLGKRFVPDHQRALPDRRYVDMAYSVCSWRGSDALNEDRLQDVFGHVL